MPEMAINTSKFPYISLACLSGVLGPVKISESTLIIMNADIKSNFLDQEFLNKETYRAIYFVNQISFLWVHPMKVLIPLQIIRYHLDITEITTPTLLD